VSYYITIYLYLFFMNYKLIIINDIGIFKTSRHDIQHKHGHGHEKYNQTQKTHTEEDWTYEVGCCIA